MTEDKGSRRLVAKVFAQTLGYSALVLADHARGKLDDERVDHWLERWSRTIYATAELSLDISGTEHVTRGQSYVVMSNHASLVDVPSIVRSFPGRLRFVAKKELAEIPLFGPAMSHAAIVVDRADRGQAIDSLNTARERLRNGISLWVAPEGTRSVDGRLGPFKKGGFHVAQDLELPILPVWVEGSREVLVTKTLIAHPRKTVHVHFGEPLPFTSGQPMAERMHEVRRSLLSLAKDLGGPAAHQFVDENLTGR